MSVEERFSFQAEVARLLHLMVHSVYSEKEVFLRELISNASDACDKLRYQAIAEPHLLEGDPEFRIELAVDKQARTLTITDNGIGMNRDELIENLGTIARSGTKAFLDQMAEKKDEDRVSLIGQFGVGFYSAFMVAESVEVISRKADAEETWKWISDGTGEFSLADTTPPEDFPKRGTRISLSLREGEDAFLGAAKLEGLVRRYSNHVAVPILLLDEGEAPEGGEAPDAEGSEGGGPRRLNEANALWTRPKSEISEEQYTEFYRHVSGGFDMPQTTIHFRAEGLNSFVGLLFVPTMRPFDLFDPERSNRLKLYVNRVFITDHAPLLPAYLRFMRGVVDSEDMPLNISREMLQNNPVVQGHRKALTGRVISELTKLMDKDRERYEAFWETFGAVVKEGLYEDRDRAEQLLKLSLFKTTKSDTWRSLKEIGDDFQEGQKDFFFITGEDEKNLRLSPQLEGYGARDLEVLLMTDPVDGFWVNGAPPLEGKNFVSVTRGSVDLSQFAKKEAGATDEGAEDPTGKTDMSPLLTFLKQSLEGKVSDVRVSERLTTSAVCLVAAEGALDLQLERLLAQQNQLQEGMSQRVLEINADHALIKALSTYLTDKGTGADLEEAAGLLLDQARILEGEVPDDVTAFGQRMTGVMTRLFAGA